MLRKSIKIINKCFFLLLIIFCLFSCNSRQKDFTYALLYDIKGSTIGIPFFRDSILITYYDKDSILIKSYYHGDYFQNKYFENKGVYFEKRIIANYPDQIFETDTILTFYNKDTTFLYHSKRDDFIVTIVDLSLFNSKYTILQDGEGYKTIKQSLVDTTYTETFFYDYC